MGTMISKVTMDGVPELVGSVAGLFVEDGGQRDPLLDTTWPEREGTTYYAALAGKDRFLCLLADHETEPRAAAAGHLIGRMAAPNPLRPDAVVAVLESMRVAPSHRRQGIGTMLVRHFRDWAVSQGANEASVTAYAANTAAITFYCDNGFVPFELTLHAPLQR